MNNDHWKDGQDVDLTNCSKEPIHIPGKIQSHGILFALSKPDLVVEHASANTTAFLGIPAKDCLGKSILSLLVGESRNKNQKLLNSDNPGEESPLLIELEHQNGSTVKFDGIVHQHKGLLFLELEPAPPEHISSPEFYRKINMGIAAVESAQGLSDMCDKVGRQVKKLTEFDRVMIYRFDSNWNGQVIAEQIAEGLEPFLGLHYPASDIPAQARELYRMNWIRVIPSVHSEPSELVPQLLENNMEPLDLSFSVLRGVSPMHIQYLKNMQVGASMSISIKKEGKLWGLIACLNKEPKHLPFELRQGLEFIGKFFSLQITSMEKKENLSYKNMLKTLVPKFSEAMRHTPEFINGLTNDKQLDLKLVAEATGAAIYFRGQLQVLGKTPSPAQMKDLVAWLKKSMGQTPHFQTDSLAAVLPSAEAYKDLASGLLCISIPEPDPSYILWFRPEVIQTVNWGGDPNKKFKHIAGGVLTPRRSFDLWKETVNLKSLPWKQEEFEAVVELRRSIVEIDLERQVEAARRSNEELDEFAHIVSHDLKEPLRGISKYAGFVVKDSKDELNKESISTLQEIESLADKAQTMLTELHEYSKLGRVDMAFAHTNLNDILNEILKRVNPFLLEKNAEVLIPRPLPVLFCDKVRVGEIFYNFIVNAAKYNDQKKKVIEVGYDEASIPPTIYVKDNGIGMKQSDQKKIFNLFHRLNPSGRYGDGSGSGLSIVKKIIDRHGGSIKVTSAPGEGTIFTFSLEPNRDQTESPLKMSAS